MGNQRTSSKAKVRIDADLDVTETGLAAGLFADAVEVRGGS